MHHVSTWGCALYHGDTSGDEGRASVLCVSKTLKNATLRQIIRTTIGGSRLTLTISNEYGQTNMIIRDVHIARAVMPGCSDIDVSTITPVTFGGKTRNLFPTGVKVTSDPVDFAVKPLERLAVSMYFEQVPGLVACHAGARANSFIRKGNAVSLETFAESCGEATVNTHWFALSNADVQAPGESRAIAVLGDSITDGYGVTDEQYTRWTDILAERLQSNPETQHLSVINMGIGTNTLLNQKNPPAAAERFGRDVLGVQGVGYFIFLIGVNDLALSAPDDDEAAAGLTGRMIGAYKKMINAARAKKIKTYGCTIPPYWYKDRRRHEINDWLRSADLEGLIDFDALVRNPLDPECMKAHFDNDGIHPSIAAYKAMGELAFNEIHSRIS